MFHDTQLFRMQTCLNGLVELLVDQGNVQDLVGHGGKDVVQNRLIVIPGLRHGAGSGLKKVWINRLELSDW